MINTIILGHALNVLPKLPAESVNCVTTSPPFWGLRDYGIEPVIWDGDKNCKHEWGNKNIMLKHKSGETNPGKEGWFKDRGASDDKGNCFCLKCGSWRGSLGLEPTFELYIKHLCDIFDEVKPVLREDGTCWVNLGDTYAGGGGWTGVPDNWESVSTGSKQERFDHNKKRLSVSDKSLCLIPQRFAIEMVNRGWILRNTLIWHKPNCMPSSAKDRFTIDFEYLFFFTKNNKILFWTNEKTLECVDKNPLGINGIEGKDWEWRPCPACSDKDYFNIRTRDVMRKEKDCPQFKASDEEKKNIRNRICPRCKGLRKIKYSFWTGHDYWFEQQFENVKQSSVDRLYRAVSNKNKWVMGADGQTPHNLSQPRPNRNYKRYGRSNAPHKFKGSNHLVSPFDPEKGRNKRCVWIIPTQPFPEAHFAVYPEGLIEIPIKAGCPEFVCKKCGKARVKIYKIIGKQITENMKVAGCDKEGKYKGTEKKDYDLALAQRPSETKKRILESMSQMKESYYTDCGCNAGFESGIVLDQFMGAGTTALVALKQRKRFIGIDIKQEYIDMSYKRIARVQQRIF